MSRNGAAPSPFARLSPGPSRSPWRPPEIANAVFIEFVQRHVPARNGTVHNGERTIVENEPMLAVSHQNGEMQAGLVEYHHGKIRILDVDGLKQVNCECHEALNAIFAASSAGTHTDISQTRRSGGTGTRPIVAFRTGMLSWVRVESIVSYLQINPRMYV